MCQECRKIEEDMIAVNLYEAPEFLKNLLNRQSPDQTPDEAATAQMDKNIAAIMEYVKSRESAVKTGIGEDLTPSQTDRFAESLAGEIMFRINSASMAYSLALLAIRYRDLLDKWATMYVAAAEDVEDLEVDLNQAVTPESKAAVTTVAQTKTVPRTPGLYL